MSAKHLREKYGTNNPFEICERQGIYVLEEDLGNIMGYHNEFHQCKFIHLNQNLDQIEGRFICAYELCQVISHHGPDICVKRMKNISIDQKANTFAVELLGISLF